MTDATDKESEEKAAYAALLLRERDPFKAALSLFPDNTNRALWVANHWPNDSVVKAEQTRLRADDGEMSFLPDKAALAADIWAKMQGTELPNGVVIPPTADEYSKLAKLYADVRGFIEKPSAPSQNVTVIVPKAIEVPNHGSNEDWEAAAERQQRELLNVSRSRH